MPAEPIGDSTDRCSGCMQPEQRVPLLERQLIVASPHRDPILSGWCRASNVNLRNTALARLDDLLLAVEGDLLGLEQLITHEFDIQTHVADVKQRIEQDGRRRRHQRIEEQRRHAGTEADRRKYTKSMPLPERVSTTAQLDGLVRELQTVQADVALYEEFELTFTR